MNNNINKLFKKNDVVLCHSIKMDREYILKSIKDLLMSKKSKYIYNKLFFDDSFQSSLLSSIVSESKDVNFIIDKFKKVIDNAEINNTDEFRLHPLYISDLCDKFEFMFLCFDVLSWETVNMICDLVKNKNTKVLILLGDVVPIDGGYHDDNEKTEGRINAIYSNLLGRNKKLFIIDGNEAF